MILNLLLISSSIDQTTSLFFTQEPELAFGLFLFSYLFFLLFLSLQSSWLHERFNYRKDAIILIANIEMILFFGYFYFFDGSHRWLIDTFQPFGITVLSVLSLTLYFTGLFICHYTIEKNKKSTTALSNAWLAICFLLPFIIPFLTLAFLNDTSNLSMIDQATHFLGITENSSAQLIFFTLLNLAFIVFTVVLLPPLAVLIWRCPKLADSPLKAELDDLCKRARFKHAGFKIWRIMNNSMTAAIIGVVGKLRYILFTQKLLDQVPNRCVTAILAHEIGHSYHFHLFYYPFILMGMVIIASLAPLLIYIPLIQFTNFEGHPLPLVPLFSFILFGLTMAIYFRIVFGYFSRIFERQADLHIFQLNVPASDMVEALDRLAVSAGNIHLEPNWHHYSIQQRIDFINQADSNRSLIRSHAKQVRSSLIIYFLSLLISVALLMFLSTHMS